MEEFTEAHRYFVQYMIHNGSVTVAEALKFLEKFNVDISNEIELNTITAQLNKEITKQYFKIAHTTCEVTGIETILWLNLKNDAQSRLTATYSTAELEFFHVTMMEIVGADNHSAEYNRTINISRTLTTVLSMDNAIKVMDKWLSGGYFVKMGENVFLGARTIAEFSHYLTENTTNCICGLCNELVFYKDCCQSCEKPFHKHCLRQYLQMTKFCPSCEERWP